MPSAMYHPAMISDSTTYNYIEKVCAQSSDLELGYATLCAKYLQDKAQELEQEGTGISLLERFEEAVVRLARAGQVYLGYREGKIARVGFPNKVAEKLDQAYRKAEIVPDAGLPGPDTVDVRIPDSWMHPIYEKNLPEYLFANLTQLAPLCRIAFTGELPAILVPTTFLNQRLFDLAATKIRQLLGIDSTSDVVYNQLTIAFPKREVELKTFITLVSTRPGESVDIIRKGDLEFAYGYWIFLLGILKTELGRMKDIGINKTAFMQMIGICEVYVNYFKSKADQARMQSSIKRIMLGALMKKPYYFSTEDLLALEDRHRRPLHSLIKREECMNIIAQLKRESSSASLASTQADKASTDAGRAIASTASASQASTDAGRASASMASADKASAARLPLVVTVTISGEEMLVASEALPLLALDLLEEARQNFYAILSGKWRDDLKAYRRIPALEDSSHFEDQVDRLFALNAPILAQLMDSGLLAKAWAQSQAAFPKDAQALVAKSGSKAAILGMQRIETKKRILASLPFWYSIPIFVFAMRFLRLFLAGKPERLQEQSLGKGMEIGKIAVSDHSSNHDSGFETNRGTAMDGKERTGLTSREKMTEYYNRLQDISRVLVPEGIKVEAYLGQLEDKWNNLLDPIAKRNLTNDVQALARDCLRGAMRTMGKTGFTLERIQFLGTTCSNSQSLKQIKNHKPLDQYIQVYMVKYLFEQRM